MAKLTKETRDKMSAAKARYWANRSPEERFAEIVKMKRGVQLKRVKRGSFQPKSLSPSFIDPDFDEGL